MGQFRRDPMCTPNNILGNIVHSTFDICATEYVIEKDKVRRKKYELRGRTNWNNLFRKKKCLKIVEIES